MATTCGRALGPLAAVFLWLSLSGVLGCELPRESVTAGEVGCRPSEIAISEESHDAGLFESSATWVAQCRGRTFICTRTEHTNYDRDSLFGFTQSDSDVSCHEEVESEPFASQPPPQQGARALKPASILPPPVSVLGLVLGASPKQAKQQCETAGYRYELHGRGRASCSGAANAVGLEGDAQLQFCGSKLCAIEVSSVPEANWEQHLTRLRAGLGEKYGEPTVLSGRIPNSCRGAKFDRCASGGALRLRYSWKWAGGQLIHLVVGGPVTGPRAQRRNGAPALRLSYIDRQAGRHQQTTAL